MSCSFLLRVKVREEGRLFCPLEGSSGLGSGALSATRLAHPRFRAPVRIPCLCSRLCCCSCWECSAARSSAPSSPSECWARPRGDWREERSVLAPKGPAAGWEAAGGDAQRARQGAPRRSSWSREAQGDTPGERQGGGTARSGRGAAWSVTGSGSPEGFTSRCRGDGRVAGTGLRSRRAPACYAEAFWAWEVGMEGLFPHRRRIFLQSHNNVADICAAPHKMTKDLQAHSLVSRPCEPVQSALPASFHRCVTCSPGHLAYRLPPTRSAASLQKGHPEEGPLGELCPVIRWRGHEPGLGRPRLGLTVPFPTA